jgi:hypothetical protein
MSYRTCVILRKAFLCSDQVKEYAASGITVAAPYEFAQTSRPWSYLCPIHPGASKVNTGKFVPVRFVFRRCD